nr:D-serine ammonia-lyase [Motiliproteus sediminis]
MESLVNDPVVRRLRALQEQWWFNPRYLSDPGSASDQLDIDQAAARLQRFAPYIAAEFPATAADGGLIESPLREIPAAQAALQRLAGLALPGRLLLKCDHALAVSGSVKARGGIHEVLKVAEQVATNAGLLTPDSDYRTLASPAARTLFARHSLVVGSTGNLGLSIGIMGAALGFRVVVHMSSDAREWKKSRLRALGVTVVEHPGDYSAAVAEGRAEALATARCHFVDDENSRDLFLGYAVAAQRLRPQLAAQGIEVSAERPLLVYLPCGVGGAPGGIAFGLKQQFGPHVHCFFAEPTQSPCMLLGMHTGLFQQIAVQDIGLDNRTCADGLACGRSSSFVGKLMQPLLSGIYTLSDDSLYRLLALLRDSEGVAMEPSAVAGLAGPLGLLAQGQRYLEDNGLVPYLANAAHLVWTTGGSMVPADELESYYQPGPHPPPGA